jgi:hypothetical protein
MSFLRKLFGNAGAKSVGVPAAKEEGDKVKFDANGKVVSIEVPDGRGT